MFSQKVKSGLRRRRIEHPETWKTPNFRNWRFGRHLPDEVRQKIGEKNKQLVGKRNGSFGTVWIYNESLEQNKKVKKEQADDFLKQGWKLGRKMSFNKWFQWLDSSGVERLPEEQRVGGAKPSPATNFNGCMKPNRQGVCGKRTGEIPNMGSNPIASTIFGNMT